MSGQGHGAGEDCLKLTTYFGERERTPDGLLADRLLAIYGAQRLHASVLLRGAEGFGHRHRLRTDRLLTLSEDLPIVAVAIDRRERIEATLELVTGIQHKGLITLERARLLDEHAAIDAAVEDLGEDAKLTVYLGRHERVGRTPAFIAVVAALARRGLAGASVLLGVDGTRRGRRVRAKFFAANSEVPLMVIAVGPRERIAASLPELRGLLFDPLITLERVRVCKRDGEMFARPHELPNKDEHGRALWQKLSVYSSNGTLHEGRPLHHAIVRALRAAGAAGASTVRGIWGFHGGHAPHGDRLMQLRRQVPALTIAIDEPLRAARSFEIIDALTAQHGLVTSELVPALSAFDETQHHDALALASMRA